MDETYVPPADQTEPTALEGGPARQRASELSDRFRQETGQELLSQLASQNPTEAAAAHRFLFLQAMAEEDQTSRALTVDTHVDLFTQSGGRASVESPFGDAELRSGRRMADVFTQDFSYSGMLASGQPIIKGAVLGDKDLTLRLDNDTLKAEFRALTEYYRQILPALQGRTFEAGMTQERVAAVLAAQTVGRDVLIVSNDVWEIAGG